MLVSQGIIIKHLSGGGGGGGGFGGTTRAAWGRMHYRGGGGGGGGGGGVQLGQRGAGCTTRTLASAGSNCSDTTKNPKMTRKEEAQFLLPPPPTHIPA